MIVEANLDSKGEVTDARVLSGPEELRKSALASVLDWHYSPDAALSRVRVTVNFGDAASARRPTVQALNGTTGIVFQGLSAEAEQELRHRLPVSEGETLDTRKITEIVREFDSHLLVMGVGPNKVIIVARPLPAVDAARRLSPARTGRQAAARRWKRASE